jgi:hypothetical protein
MKQLKGDAKSARVSFPAACGDKTNFTFIDTPRLAAGRFIIGHYDLFRACDLIATNSNSQSEFIWNRSRIKVMTQTANTQ